MDLKKLIRILRKNTILIVAFVLLGAGAGVLASALTPVKYSSATKLFVAVQITPGATTGDLVQGNNFAVQKVLSYSDVVTSARVLDPVINDLALDASTADLARDVTSTVEPNSVIIEIAAVGATAESATTLSTAVADSFTNVVVNQLEKPADGSPSPVKVEVLEPATPSDSPASPQWPLNIALGTAIGLIVGLLVALVLGLLDRRIHGISDLERITDSPILGKIAEQPRGKKRPLIAQDDPRGARVEAFRTLRTNLQFVGVDGGARSIVVTSTLPGEGKTTSIVNLAIVLAEAGHRVALVDADLRVPRVAQYLGIEGAVGLTDVLIGVVSLGDALQPWGQNGAISALPAGRVPPNPSELLGSRAMVETLGTLSQEFDFVLIDAPPVLNVTDAAVLSQLVSGVLFVVAAGRVKETEVRGALDALDRVGARPLGVVMTMLPTRGPDAYGGASYGSTPLHEDAIQLAPDETSIDPARRQDRVPPAPASRRGTQPGAPTASEPIPSGTRRS